MIIIFYEILSYVGRRKKKCCSTTSLEWTVTNAVQLYHLAKIKCQVLGIGNQPFLERPYTNKKPSLSRVVCLSSILSCLYANLILCDFDTIISNKQTNSRERFVCFIDKVFVRICWILIMFVDNYVLKLRKCLQLNTRLDGTDQDFKLQIKLALVSQAQQNKLRKSVFNPYNTIPSEVLSLRNAKSSWTLH